MSSGDGVLRPLRLRRVLGAKDVFSMLRKMFPNLTLVRALRCAMCALSEQVDPKRLLGFTTF